MDAQFWIYIVIGVIYFISRLLKKPEQAPGESPDAQQPQRRRPGQPEQSTEKPRPMTFEELLREITEQKQTPGPATQPKAETRHAQYEEIPEKEARSLERVDFDEAENARIFQKYEEAQALAQERKSLEETLRLEDTVVDFSRFKAFEKKKRPGVVNDYIDIIRDPQRLKHAVVMSEILKRKF